jgi:hypothetical protein
MICLYVGTAQGATAVAPSAEQLLDGWKNAIYTDREHSKLNLTLIDADGSKLLRQGEIWYKGKGADSNRILMRFNSPSTIRGIAFLSLRSSGQTGADQWLYIPAYKKARRLSSHGRDESFLDSDFTNGDISFEYEDAFTFKVAGEKRLANQEVYLVEGTIKPAKRAELAYSREVLYISKSEKLNLRTEFYDQKNKLVKVLTVGSWKKYAHRWAADKIEVENAITKHRSILEFSARDIDADPADRIFTLSELESGR